MSKNVLDALAWKVWKSVLFPRFDCLIRCLFLGSLVGCLALFGSFWPCPVCPAVFVSSQLTTQCGKLHHFCLFCEDCNGKGLRPLKHTRQSFSLVALHFLFYNSHFRHSLEKCSFNKKTRERHEQKSASHDTV